MPLVADTVCVKCGRPKGSKHLVTTKQPSMRKMEHWAYDSVAEATDGCKVEPDGQCPHGHSSWMIVLGMI